MAGQISIESQWLICSVESRIDASCVKQYETNCRYWRQVLQRCVDVLKFICERGLAIPGKDSLMVLCITVTTLAFLSF